MPSFSNSSKKIIETCDPKIQKVFNEVVKYFDCVPIYGFRSPELQLELFNKGRSYIDGNWIVVDKNKVVTYKDGTDKKSKHNFSPSIAIDIIPYYKDEPHIRWDDIKRMYYFAGFVMKTAHDLNIDLVWGGDWDEDTEVLDQTFMDLAHFEIKK